MLLLQCGEALTVDRLVDAVRGERGAAGASTTLRTNVGQVRRALDSAGTEATLERRAGPRHLAYRGGRGPARPLPPTVRDAVLARTTGVTPDDFEVLQLVAAAPDRLDERVLPGMGVGLEALRRLEGTGLLIRSRGGLAYRHDPALTRETSSRAGSRPMQGG